MNRRKLDGIDKLLRLFPRPWSVQEIDPSGNCAVTDATGRLLFYLDPDWDAPDHDQPKTGMHERPDLSLVVEKLFK